MSEHTAMQGDLRSLQADVDQLTQELAAATARADALDVRCSAAERVAIAADKAATNANWNHASVPLTADLTTALELWRRVDASHHGTRAHDYADAVTQLAEARRRVPALEPDDWAHVEREAAHWKQSVPEWLSDSITQYLSEYGQVK